MLPGYPAGVAVTPPPYPTQLVGSGPVRSLAIRRSVAGSSQRGRVCGTT